MTNKIDELRLVLLKMATARDSMRLEASQANVSVDMRAVLHKAEVHLSAAIENLVTEIARMHH